MITLSRVQFKNAVAPPGGAQADGRYEKASKEQTITFDAGLVLITKVDGDGKPIAQTIVPIANVDFMTPIEIVAPRGK